MSAKRKASESPANTPKKARKVLTLAQKVQALDLVHGGMSHRAVADKFNVGHTQINNIVLQKQRIMKDYESGKNATGKYLYQLAITGDYDVECTVISKGTVS